MRLTILGCSGSYPGPGSACSSYLVQGGGRNVVLDMGSGSLANLQLHIDIGDIDAVVLTHRHPDHWADLTGLRVAWKYALGREGLPVYGTGETMALADAVCDGVGPTFDWHVPTGAPTFALGGMEMTFARTDHYVETYAVRLDERGSGRSLAYSADTGPAWSLSSLGTGIHTALCEATYPTDEAAEGILHLSARRAGEMAREAGVQRLILTHLLPGSDAEVHRAAAAEAFGAPVEVAEINASYEL